MYVAIFIRTFPINIRIYLNPIHIQSSGLRYQNTVYFAEQNMSALVAVDGSSTGIAMCQIAVSVDNLPMSPFGTKRKCHRRVSTSAFGRITDIHRDGLSLSRRLRLARQNNSRKWGVWLVPRGNGPYRPGPSEAIASRTPAQYASYSARIPSNSTRVARQSSSLYSRICCLIAGSRVSHQRAYHSIEAAPKLGGCDHCWGVS